VGDGDWDEACDLLQRDGVGTVARQVDGAADGWVAGERDLGTGKKMRTLAVWAGSSGVWTKIVSLRLNCRAMVCICAVVSPSASSTMASGLPVKGVEVKTS
jgi:hypothetical protein